MYEYLFSYGTLQNSNVQKALFGRILQGWPDSLMGYKVVAIEITDEVFLAKGEQKDQLTAIVSKDNTDSIKGTVFQLTADELLFADKYEPAGFIRINVILDSGKEAWLYTTAEIA